jgi:hypothetical protein
MLSLFGSNYPLEQLYDVMRTSHHEGRYTQMVTVEIKPDTPRLRKQEQFQIYTD